MDAPGSLLCAVRDAPDEDAPRLVLADWLEEHGRPAHAALIRIQCEREHLDESDDRFWDLRGRELALLAACGKGVAGRELRRLVKRYGIRRGFVDHVTLDAADFLKHGEQLFRLAPVTSVRLLRAAGLISELARLPFLPRIQRLDLRHTDDLSFERAAPLLRSPVWRACERSVSAGRSCVPIADCSGWRSARTWPASNHSTSVSRDTWGARGEGVGVPVPGVGARTGPDGLPTSTERRCGRSFGRLTWRG